ncbi:RES family NAD+ phosphorylase [Dyadobacter psychrotolerans]|uniref:RES domain-containing protein n=1 Tax=Dyadobacter psychrotolerans TaxID=2541721 RepID=A0A4R5DIF3_9BACT|nr:RES family NAD+ phosphorylase [Dyadobacter psychrotolerans]TDE13892.1 RES domain-containing protein [Dyadobacter psychrotolerans]
MPTVYRIIREKFRDQALSTEGSRFYGARWNPKGTGILYTTSSPELGLVETLAHAPAVRYEDLPVYWLTSIDIPDNIRYYNRLEMPDFWQDKNYERTQFWLNNWLQNPDVPAIALPSVIVPFSFNILLHPKHTLSTDIQILAQERIPIDRCLWKAD